MILIVVTSLVFHKSFTPVGLAGLATSMVGFISFQYFRDRKTNHGTKDLKV